IDFRAPLPLGHTAGRAVWGHHYVADENVGAVGVPDVRVESVVNDHVVVGVAVEAFAELEAAVEQKVVVDLVIAGAIIEVDVPAMIAAPPAVTDDDGLHHVQHRQLRQLIWRRVLQSPEPVAAPGVEAAVVSGLEHSVEYVTEFDHVPTPGSFTDVDAGSG